MARHAITAADFLARVQAQEDFARRYRRYGPPSSVVFGFLSRLPAPGEEPAADDPLRRVKWFAPDDAHFEAWMNDYLAAMDRGELGDFLDDPATYMEKLQNHLG